MTVVAPGGALTACGPVRARDGLRFVGLDFEPQLMRRELELFAGSNPGIGVDYTPIDEAMYVRQVGARFDAGHGPDALMVTDDRLASWADAGFLQSLEGFSGLDEVYDAIYPGIAATMTYGGSRYGMPYDTDATCLVYNAKLLDRAGFSAPPQTLDALLRQAVVLKDRGFVRYPIGLSAQESETWWPWWWALVFASGGQLFDNRMNPIMATSEPVVRDLLDWLRNAAANGVIDPAAHRTPPEGLDDAFMAGRHGFVVTSRHSARLYNDPAYSTVAGQAAIAMIPSLDGTSQGTVSSSRMFGLASDTARKADAYRLISHLGGLDGAGFPRAARFWFEQRGLGFAYEALAREPDIRAALGRFADPRIYAQLSEVARPRRVIAMPWYAEFETASQRLIRKVLAGSEQPAHAVRQMERTVHELAAHSSN